MELAILSYKPVTFVKYSQLRLKFSTCIQFHNSWFQLNVSSSDTGDSTELFQPQSREGPGLIWASASSSLV